MELVQEPFRSLQLAAEAYTTQEEVAEAVVSDVLPDAARVVDTRATVTVRDRLPREDGAEIRATVHMHVLCAAERPQGGEKLICIETPLVFTHRAELPGAPADAELMCDAKLLNADARLLNPRKLSVRAELLFHTRAYGAVQAAVTTGLSGDESLMLLRRRAYLRTAAETCIKHFTVIDEVPIPDADLAEPLLCTAEMAAAETLCAAGQLTIRGRAAVRLLYNDSRELAQNGLYEIPFEQAIEMPSVTDAMQGETVLTLKTTEMSPAEDTSGQKVLSVSISVCAETVLFEEREVSVLTDAYSTAYQTEIGMESFTYDEPIEPWEQRIPAEEKIEAPYPVTRLIDWSLGVQGYAEAEADGAVFHILFQAICEGDDGLLFGVSRRLPVSVDAPCPAACLQAGIEDASVTLNDGLAVRFTLSVKGACSAQRVLDMVSAIDEGESIRNAEGPALILRFPASETVWALAKEYHASLQTVRMLNGLDETADMGQEMPRSPMLIPRVQ